MDSNDYGFSAGQTERQKNAARAQMAEQVRRNLAQHAMNAWASTRPALRAVAVELNELSDEDFRIVTGLLKEFFR